MSIVEILKENYLFENENEPIFVGQITTTSGNNEIKIDNSFVIKLINHLDRKFALEYGTLDDQIYNEIRQFLNGIDNKTILKVKERIHKIIKDEKDKLLKRIQRRVLELKISKKER